MIALADVNQFVLVDVHHLETVQYAVWLCSLP